LRVTVLGCGSSGGTPMIGSGWGAADPNEPKNRRQRASVMVEEGDTRILVDVSPDVRAQLLATEVTRLDAILFTHAHADHCHGIDDLRPINEAMNADIPAYADAAAWEMIGRRFDYVLEPRDPRSKFYYKPCLVPNTVAPGDTVTVGSVTARAFDHDHGWLHTLGYRFGAFAYSTDVVALPEESFAALEGIDTWIVGTLGSAEHPTHAHVDKALGWIERVRPKRAFLTHMSNRLDYATLCRILPPHVRPAYDGLILEIPE
jgi:phosphoribosyl 1,2-cyclic phosphate phosphodiesterase